MFIRNIQGFYLFTCGNWMMRDDATHPSAEAGGEAVKDEVRESLGHGADIRDVVSHHHVVQGEIRRRPEGQVAHDQPVWRHKTYTDTQTGGAGQYQHVGARFCVSYQAVLWSRARSPGPSRC